MLASPVRAGWVGFLALIFCIPPGDAPGADWSLSHTNGLRWSWFDQKAQFHAGGVFAGDLMYHETDEHPNSGAYASIAKPILEATYDDVWRLRVAGDLIGTRTAYNLYEAFVAWEGVPWLRVSGGLQRLPLGFEAGFAPEDLALFSHSFSYYMDYSTDWALRAEGSHGQGILEWDVSYGFGAGFDANGRDSRGPQLLGRAFVRPLRFLSEPDAGILKRIGAGFFAGAGYVYSWDWDGDLIVRSPVGTRLFDTDSFDADSTRFLTLSLGFEVDRFRVSFENTVGGYYDAETPAGTQDLDNQTTSWSVGGSWMIKGEPYDGRIFRQAQTPPPGPNAWEIALRYANADIDRDFYKLGLTDYATSDQEFRSVVATLNWYATRNLRLSLGAFRLIGDDDIASLDNEDRDTGVMLRVQYRF